MYLTIRQMNRLLFIVILVSAAVLQLIRAVRVDYAAARSLAFYEQPLIRLLNELRLPGDTLIILGAALLLWELAPKIISLLLGRTPAAPDKTIVETEVYSG